MKRHFKFFELGKNKIRYIVQRTRRRRSIGICVMPDTRVVIRAPKRLAKGELDRILEKRAEWILERQNYFRNNKDRFPIHEFISGEKLPYLGGRISLQVYRGVSGKRRALLEGRHLSIYLRDQDDPKEVAYRQVLKWYRLQTEKIVKESLARFCLLLGISPKKVTIRNQRHLWGSCTNHHHISFNWRLALLPLSILDYVVAHELCHLFHLNHSDKFWKKLKEIVPDYQERRRWLKEGSMELLSFPRMNTPI